LFVCLREDKTVSGFFEEDHAAWLSSSAANYTWIGGLLVLSLINYLGTGMVLRPQISAGDRVRSVSLQEVRAIINRRCVRCHSSKIHGADPAMAPAGITFDTTGEILLNAKYIHSSVVEFRTMPPSNITNVTSGERDLLARWYADVKAATE
jgi:uncharacterized membrane protein